MDWILEHSKNAFFPGKASIFFRNCIAVLIIFILLCRFGILKFTPNLLSSGICLSLFSIVPTCSKEFYAWFFLLLLLRILICTAEYCLNKYSAKTDDMDDPDSKYYKVTPALWILESIVISITYIYSFVYSLSVITRGLDQVPSIPIVLIAVIVFSDIIDCNYIRYRAILEKSHFQDKACAYKEGHSK
jgi:hypothetical protein